MMDSPLLKTWQNLYKQEAVMDRYTLSNGFISEDGEVIPSVFEIKEKLNTLTRELEEANAACARREAMILSFEAKLEAAESTLKEIICGDCEGTGANRSMAPCWSCGGNGISPDIGPLGDYIKALKSQEGDDA